MSHSINAETTPVKTGLSKRTKLILIGTAIILAGAIAIGVGVGVSVNKNKNNNTLSTSSSNGPGSSNSNSTSGGSSSGSTPSDPNDPSQFELDPRLHKSFYGFAYQPEGSLLPNCTNSLDAVIKDVQLLSQLTTRIRLYGADCNQSALVLEAIKRTKVDMQVFLGIYPVPEDNTPYTRQRDLVKAALQTYGVDHVAGITVGNEFMLNYVTTYNESDPNSDIGNKGAEILLADIADTRAMIASLNLPKTIPVGNSDAGAYFNTKVLEAVDYGLSNVHPWFAHTSINDAAAWTASYFDETNVQPANALPNKPKMYIAETGWPTKSSDKEHESDGASIASEENLQIFLDTFVCQANQNGTGYFYFEFFDETWKDALYGGVEAWWGLFTANRTLKSVTIPNCPLS
jgi:exo-beta-1,3-glucanase (GH17 family)